MTTYHRPTTLEEALHLLASENARPLGGGTSLSRSGRGLSLVDLQSLGLDTITRKGSRLEVGATVRLQTLMDSLGDDLPALQQALRLEAPHNLRNMRTLAGALLTADGRSPLAAAIMALDVTVRRIPFTADGKARAEERLSAGEWLLQRQTDPEKRQLVLGFNLPLNVRLGFAHVARTPSDRPMLSAAVAQWPSGRTRLVMGGWGTCPTLAMDGTGAEGLPAAARNACYEAADDFASAEYRREVGPTLAKRALQQATDS